MNNIRKHLMFQSFKLSKPGEHINQDAITGNLEYNRFAISDGVSQSFYPEIFSQLLVDHFCKDNDQNLLFSDDDWLEWLSPVQSEWQTQVADHVKSLPANSWIMKNKLLLREQAAATFAGIEFTEGKVNLGFRIALIGDSCVFQIRNKKLINIYGIKNSNEFDNFPNYFSSYPSEQKHQPIICKGEMLKDDIVLLATDEFSKWLLKHYEQSQKSWDECLNLLSCIYLKSIDFNKVINFARRTDRSIVLGDDDIALGIITIGRLSSFQKLSMNVDQTQFLKKSDRLISPPVSTTNAGGNVKNIEEKSKLQTRSLNQIKVAKATKPMMRTGDIIFYIILFILFFLVTAMFLIILNLKLII